MEADGLIRGDGDHSAAKEKVDHATDDILVELSCPQVAQATNKDSEDRSSVSPEAGLGDVTSLFEIDLEALDEQERQLRAQEEQERKREAERHTRELAAKEEADRKAREQAESFAKEAEEVARKTVEEAERNAKEEERKQREEEEHRIEQETARKVREEKERQIREEAERRDREEAEAKARAEAARKAQEKEEKKRAKEEERSRKHAEAEAKAHAKAAARAEAKREVRVAKKPAKWVRPAVISACVALVAAVGLVHVIPFDGYGPGMEKAAGATLGEPVKIGSVRLALLPFPQFKLEGVTIGKGQDVKVASVRAVPELSSLFSDRKALSSLELNTVTADQEVLRRVPAWVEPGTAKPLKVSRIALREVKLATRAVAIPPFDGDATMGADGALAKAVLRTQDGKLTVNLRNKPDGLEVDFDGRGWKPPLGPGIEFEEISGKAIAKGTEMTWSDLSARLYGGRATGHAKLSWDGPWILTGDFSAHELDFAAVLKPFTGQFRASGRLETTVRYTAQAASLDQLFVEPRVDAAFKAARGELDNVDLTRALQQAAAGNPVRGGKTQFAEFTGTLNVSEKGYHYRQLALASGILLANGGADLVASGDLSGRLNVELAAKPNSIRAVVALSGRLSDPQLKASR